MSSSTQKSDANPDRESLMALHALLQIKSKNSTSNTDGKGDEQEDQLKPSKPLRKRMKKETRSAQESEGADAPLIQRPNVGGSSVNHLHSLSSSVSFAQTARACESIKNLQTMNSNMNGQPLHGFLNFAAAPSTMGASAAQFSAAINALMQPNPMGLNQRFLSSQFRSETTNVPLPLSNQVIRLPTNDQFAQQGTSSFTAEREVVASMDENALKMKDPHGITPATSPSPTQDELIRREEVEAALKSKPQRGRKRENLSVMERLELTRTRNREHAKSTRIRKKQRYQELVDNERRLQELQSAEDLSMIRRQTVMKFVKIREQMLNNLRSGSIENATTTNESTFKQASIRCGSVSFCNLQDSMESADKAAEEEQSRWSESVCESRTDENKVAVLSDVIDNIASFSFNASPLGKTGWVRPEGVHALTGVTMMKRFDNSILSLLQQHVNDVAIPALSYSVQGSFEGIAVNAEGKGFARVDLVLQGIDSQTSQALVSSILTVKFAGDSDKLTAVEWTVVLDRLSPRSLETERGQDNRSDSGESLASQTVYPSVVSLDHHNVCGSGSDTAVAKEGRPTEAEEGPGPGMNI